MKLSKSRFFATGRHSTIFFLFLKEEYPYTCSFIEWCYTISQQFFGDESSRSTVDVRRVQNPQTNFESDSDAFILSGSTSAFIDAENVEK